MKQAYRSIFVSSVMLLLCLPFLFSYSQTGGDSSGFEQTLGFTSQTLGQAYSIGVLSGKIDVPLSDDLDKDNSTEIIYKDGNSIFIANKSDDSFYTVDSITVGTADTYTSNMLIYDIDGDGSDEIIIAHHGDNQIKIYNYSGSDLQLQANFSSGMIGNFPYVESVIGCIGANRCIIAYSNNTFYGQTGYGYVRAIDFNSTENLGLDYIVDTTVINTNKFCFPNINHMAFGDYNSDGTDELALSYIDFAPGGNSRIRVSYLKFGGIAPVGSFTTQNDCDFTEAQMSTRYPDYASTRYCQATGVGEMITAPIVYKAGGYAGLQTVIGYMKDSGFALMEIFDGTTNPSHIKTYPNILTIPNPTTSSVVYNIFRGDIFTATGENDFCMALSYIGDSTYKIVCANPALGFSDHYTNPYTITSNLSYGYNHSEGLAHSIKNIEDTAGRVLSPYGILQFYQDDTDMTLYAAPGYDDSAAVPVLNIQDGTGLKDILLYNDDVLIYYDDNLINTGAQIRSYSINPCISEGAWKINTTLQITITPYDAFGDKVAARAVLYYGTPFEQDSGYSSFFNPDTPITISSLDPNVTISSSVLRLYAKDDDIGQETFIDIAFSVASEGISFGDCRTESGDLIAAAATAAAASGAASNYTNTDNKIKTAIDETAHLAGVPPLIFILFVMLGIDLLIIVSLFRAPTLIMWAISLIDGIGLLIVFLMGYILEGILISFFAIIIILGGLWLSSLINNRFGGGG